MTFSYHDTHTQPVSITLHVLHLHIDDEYQI